ncbi:MAG: glycosyltransferase family 87 protein [Candidatus Limnocylindrales bacterium]
MVSDGWRPGGAASGAIVLVRLVIIAAIFGELWVTGTIHLPNLLHPTIIGSDPSNYFAAGQRLNAGHDLYGPLRFGDRPVPGYPGLFPAPLLSPPLIAVIWRPLAALGEGSMTAWWAACLAVVIGLAIWFAVAGDRITLAGLVIVLALGWPVAVVLRIPYQMPGFQSPLSIAALSGNLNGIITALAVVVWWAASQGRSRLAGAAAALATVLKLGPLALGWWLVVRRDWRAVEAFIATGVVLGLVGLVGAGLDANLAFIRFALGAGVSPTPLSIPGMLHTWFHVNVHAAEPGTIVAVVVGFVVVALTRNRPRVSFLAAILVIIYSSPVVLTGNFVFLLAALSPWHIPARPGAQPTLRERVASLRSAFS